MNESSKTRKRLRTLRRILIGLAVLVTLIALFYTEEDWRGKRAWENYKREWEAKGEKFNWHAFVPPSVPADKNFFTAPIFANIQSGKITLKLYGKGGGPDFLSFKDVPSDEIGYIGGNGRIVMTGYLKAWQKYYRNHVTGELPGTPKPQTPARDVLFALSKFDPAIEELRQASRRPYANVPLNYQNGFNATSILLPYLATLKRCAQVLHLRAFAELADGQSAKSLDDVKLLLYLNNSLRNSPFLISYLVRIAIVAIDLQPIWEGLAKHQWTDKELIEINAELSKVDFLADYEHVMRGERAFAIGSLENQRRTREILSRSANGKLVTNRLTLMPSAYFYQSELSIARMQHKWILPLVNTNSRTVSPEVLRRADEAVRAERKHYSLYRVQALMSFPALANVVKKLAAIQSSVDLARVACALERYRLACGEYPKALDALTPQFMDRVPRDIIGGGPLHYQRTQDGKFLLYSVGWNETDDGGKVVFTQNGSTDREKGDWVWQYPAN